MPLELKPLAVRACLQPDTLLSAEEAEHVLPGRPELVSEWLSAQAPHGRIGGEPVYRWQDLVAAIASGAAGTERIGITDAARLLGLSRGALDAVVREAPSDLPNAPFAAGAGRSRRHWRFESAGLDAWWAAYRSWKAGQRPAPGAPRRRARGDATVEGAPVDWQRAAGELR